MVSFNDILDVITTKLNDNYPDFDVLTGNNEEEIVTPTFLVTLHPLTPKQEGREGVIMTVNVYIGYITKDFKQADTLDILKNLIRIFFDSLSVVDSDDKDCIRTLPIFNPQMIYGDMPQISFSLTYHDRIAPVTQVDKNEDYDDTINNIYIKTKVNGLKGDDIIVNK